MGLGYILKNKIKGYFSGVEQTTLEFIDYQRAQEILSSIEGEEEYTGNGKERIKGTITLHPNSNGKSTTTRKEALEFLTSNLSPLSTGQDSSGSYQVFEDEHTFTKKHYLCLELRNMDLAEIPVINPNIFSITPKTTDSLERKAVIEFETYKPAYNARNESMFQYDLA